MLKKIFTILIVMVACIMIGALALNILLPNVTKALVDSTEDGIFKATGMAFDFNGDGQRGQANRNYDASQTNNNGGTGSAGVDGFQAAP